MESLNTIFFQDWDKDIKIYSNEHCLPFFLCVISNAAMLK